MTRVSTPLGGTLQWQFRTFTYAGGISYREIQNRWMTALPGGVQNLWQIVHDDSGDASRPVHYWTQIWGSASVRTWYSYTNTGPFFGLPYYYIEYNSDLTVSLTKQFNWMHDAAANVYMSVMARTLNPFTSNAVMTQYTQTLDIYGNITQSQVWTNNNLTTPARTYTYGYQHQSDANYTSRYPEPSDTGDRQREHVGNLLL